MSTTPQDSEQAIVIDGQATTLDDLTFREQRDMRRIVRELAEDPDITPGEAALMDFLPALAYVVKRRTEPDFTIEQALDMRFDDVVGDRPTQPAKPAAKKKTDASNGARATS